MGTPAIRDVTFGNAENADVVLSSPADTAATDLLVAIHGTDYYTLAGMTTPTPGTWSAGATADRGSNSVHLKSWTRTAGSSGAQSVTFPQNSDAVNHGVLLTLSGIDVAYDVGGGGVGTAASGDAPSVDPVFGGDLLICAWITNALEDIVPPGSMTERAESDFTPWTTLSVATEVLAADTATGVRNATWGASRAWAALSLTISASDTPGGGYVVTVWDGATEQAATLEGVWNGSTVDAATIETVTT